METRDEVTAALAAAGGDATALDRVLPVVYDELRALARRHRWQWRNDQAPGTVSLVHEAYLKLVDQTRIRWESRAQFFYLASRAMRSILIDHARRLSRLKRGGGADAIPIDEELLVAASRSDELLSLDDALTRLAGHDPDLARIVECRFFGGLTIEETAAALGVSPATVKRGWTSARARLYQDLQTTMAPPLHAPGPEGD